jgi:hypothetical protein
MNFLKVRIMIMELLRVISGVISMILGIILLLDNFQFKKEMKKEFNKGSISDDFKQRWEKRSKLFTFLLVSAIFLFIVSSLLN